MPSSLLQVVNSLFQTCSNIEFWRYNHRDLEIINNIRGGIECEIWERGNGGGGGS